MVGCKSVPSNLLMHDHNSDTNCGPLSEVMCNGTPNLATQFWMYALAIVYVSVSRMGTASSQRVKRSAAVRRYKQPCDSGRGPTKSMWTCSKRRDVGSNLANGALVCQWIFARWQGTQQRAHIVISLPSPCQTNLEDTSFFVVLAPG